MSLACETEVEQPRPLINRNLLRASVPALKAYGAALVLSLVLTFVLLKLWRADLRIPFQYSFDGLLAQVLVKSVVDHGWYLHNPNLGAPLAMEFYDFPMAESLHFLMIKIVSLFSSDYTVVINVCYLMTYPLVALTSLFVFRKFAVGYIPALVGSQLFTFLPYHLYRGEGHIFLSGYFVVPLSVMVMLWLALDRFSPAAHDDEAGNSIGKSQRNRLIGSIAICLLQASAGVYYAFFACYLFLIAGASAALQRRRLRPLLTGVLFVAVTGAGVVANILPNLIYQHHCGKNPDVGRRVLIEAELYALRLAQIVLPVPHHRIPAFARLRAEYEGALLSSGETMMAVLGTAGTIGFLTLLIRLLYRRTTAGGPRTLDGLATLNLFAILLGTSGAFGSVFNLLVTPQIRAYNRISIYIACFSLLAGSILLQRLSERFAWSGRRPWQFPVLAGLILCAAIFDQTPRGASPDFSNMSKYWKHDTEFFGRVEAALPAQAAIFQFPYMSFPEHPPIHKMSDYDHLRGYLHSDSLRWSYGAIRGRQADLWMKQTLAKPVEEQLQAMAISGFSGIYVNRRGYDDHGAKLEKTLARLLRTEPLISQDENIAVYSMVDYAARLKRSLSPEEWDRRKAANLEPLYITWNKGFYDPEVNKKFQYRWSESSSEFMIHNPSQSDKQVALEFTCATAYPFQSRCVIRSPLFNSRVEMNATGTKYSTTVTVPPGDHKVKLTSNAPRLDAPGDPRKLVFQVQDAKFRDITRR